MEDFLLFGSPPPQYSLAFPSARLHATPVAVVEHDSPRDRSRKRPYDRISDEPMSVEEDDDLDGLVEPKRSKTHDQAITQQSVVCCESAGSLRLEQKPNRKKRGADKLDPITEDDDIMDDESLSPRSKRVKRPTANDPSDEDEPTAQPPRRAHFLRVQNNIRTHLCEMVGLWECFCVCFFFSFGPVCFSSQPCFGRALVYFGRSLECFCLVFCLFSSWVRVFTERLPFVIFDY